MEELEIYAWYKMRHSFNSILELPERYRRNLINSIHGAKTVFLVGTRNASHQSNLAVFSQVLHIGSNPPLVGLLFRPDSVQRHTLMNIRETKVFTIQNVRENFFRQAHLTSARYPEDVSEFNQCDLTEEIIADFKAPFVRESSIKIGLSLNSEIPIEVNGTHLIIGQIELIDIEESLISDDGFIDAAQAGSRSSGGLDSYYSLKRLARLSYGKQNQGLKGI